MRTNTFLLAALGHAIITLSCAFSMAAPVASTVLIHHSEDPKFADSCRHFAQRFQSELQATLGPEAKIKPMKLRSEWFAKKDDQEHDIVMKRLALRERFKLAASDSIENWGAVILNCIPEKDKQGAEKPTGHQIQFRMVLSEHFDGQMKVDMRFAKGMAPYYYSVGLQENILGEAVYQMSSDQSFYEMPALMAALAHFVSGNHDRAVELSERFQNHGRPLVLMRSTYQQKTLSMSHRLSLVSLLFSAPRPISAVNFERLDHHFYFGHLLSGSSEYMGRSLSFLYMYLLLESGQRWRAQDFLEFNIEEKRPFIRELKLIMSQMAGA